MPSNTITEFHEVANIFPRMSDEEFLSLVEDIKENGLREAIWTKDDKIIDGRNRFLACKEADVDPRFREYEGEDLVSFVLSLNLERRHLSESQRAMIAARLSNLKKGSNQHTEGLPIGRSSEMLNVGERSVYRARDVQDKGIEELVEAVDSGEISVSAAAAISQLPREEQKEAFGNQRTIGTGENEWYTPSEYIELSREVLGEIDLDPASCEQANEIVKAKTFYTKEDNGLEKEWVGRVFMNPPYSKDLMPKFVEKITSEKIESAIILTHNNTDTKWFHQLSEKASAVCFTKGRISFYRDNIGASPTNGQAFFYIGKDVDLFASVFKKIGAVMVPYAS